MTTTEADGRDPRQPRDLDRALPGTQRLRQLAAEPAHAEHDARPACCRGSSPSRRARTTSGSARTSSATKEHGFSRPLLFTNEEATDFVNRTGTACPRDARTCRSRRASSSRTTRERPVQDDLRHGPAQPREQRGAARVQAAGHPLGRRHVLRPSSQMYMYLAKNADEVWNDQGSLWAFKSDVDDDQRLRRPLRGHREASRASSSRCLATIAVGDADRPQRTGRTLNNVFQFIRAEDIAYDRNKSNVVYLADTGEPRAVPGTAVPPTRLARGGAVRRPAGSVVERPHLQVRARQEGPDEA